MKSQIAGPGCPNCRTTERNGVNACAELDFAADISQVTNIADTPDPGVMRTPAVVIDGEVVLSGRVRQSRSETRTPVHETARLQDDLQPAGIKPYAFLAERGSREAPYIAEVRDRLSTRSAAILWKPAVPAGPELSRELAGDSLALAGASKG